MALYQLPCKSLLARLRLAFQKLSPSVGECDHEPVIKWLYVNPTHAADVAHQSELAHDLAGAATQCFAQTQNRHARRARFAPQRLQNRG